MNKLVQRIALAAVVTTASLLWAEPIAHRALGSLGISEAKTTLAQRYPLRARSKDFFGRSKISHSRGK